MTHGVKAMSNTVEYKGGVYEAGKLYEFSDDGESWIGLELKGFTDSNYPFRSPFACYKRIRAIEPSSIGTITKAPVKPIDGEAYQFNYNNGSQGMSNAVMRCREAGDYFFFDNTIFKREHCDNIQHLTVGEK